MSVDRDNVERKQRWSVGRRRLVSVLILLHLAAVVIAPWSSPPPSPLLAETLANWFGPYQSAAFLNHGYRFFAPDPGPSHIVRFKVKRQDGSQLEGQIPDPRRHWPRLLYHRHFMMTEMLFNNWSRIETIPADAEIPAADRQLIESRNAYAQQLVDAMASGMAQHLLRRFDGETVELTLQEHQIPFPLDVAAGQPLDDPRLYVDLAQLGTVAREP